VAHRHSSLLKKANNTIISLFCAHALVDATRQWACKHARCTRFGQHSRLLWLDLAQFCGRKPIFRGALYFIISTECNQQSLKEAFVILPIMLPLWMTLITSKSVQTVLQTAIRKKMDLLPLSTKLAKAYEPNDRKIIMDYLALVPKFREKFGTEDFLVCDKLALEQSTAKDIGHWKAALWPIGSKVNDLCCGMGGDSFFIPSTVTVTGVDLDPDRIAMYEYNTAILGTSRKAVLADVRTFENDADYFCIDPARRETEGDNQRDFLHLTPTLAEVLLLSEKYKGGMAKIPPGYPTDEIPKTAEIVYVGNRTDCRECLVLLGALAKNPGKVRAVMVSKTGDIIEWVSTAFRTDSPPELPLGPVKKFIVEPIPLLVRSHLFTQIAAEKGYHLFSHGIAYITADEPLTEIGFTNYEVLETSAITTSAVRSILKAHDVGKLTLKKRGVEIIPEDEIKRLAPRGKKEGILFYTRIAGEKVAILTTLYSISTQE